MEHESVESWKCFIKDITEEDVKIIGIYKFYFIKLNSLQNNINQVLFLFYIYGRLAFGVSNKTILYEEKKNYSLIGLDHQMSKKGPHEQIDELHSPPSRGTIQGT